jgi:signal transduction histidine kinase
VVAGSVGRQFVALLTICAVVIVGSICVVVWPPVQSTGAAALDAELSVVAPLHDVLPFAGFIGLLAAKQPDSAHGFEYTLELADGVVPVGRLPKGPLRRASQTGYWEYDAAEEGQTHTRLAVRQCFTNGDCLTIGERVDQRLFTFRQSVVALLAAFLLGLLFTGLHVANRVRQTANDVRHLKDAVARLLSGDLAQRLPMTTHTEFAQVVAQLNRLLERIEHLTFATRTVIDSTAHDLRTPLYRLRSRLEQGLLPGGSESQMADTIEAALHEIDGIETTLDALLRITLAESGSASMAPVNLAEVVADVIELYRPLAEDKNMTLGTDLDAGQLVNGNAQLLAQAVANLFDNAIKYTPSGGRIEVRVERRGPELVVSVADSGPGIPAVDRARAMERSRRLANAVGTSGSGLGLALVVAVARLHGGRLLLGDHEPGLLAEFVLPC